MSPLERVTVAIVGGGPAGVGVAVGLARQGMKGLVLIERNEEIGGIPGLSRTRPEGIPTFLAWRKGRFVFGDAYARQLRSTLARQGIEVRLETNVIAVVPSEKKLTLVSPSRGKADMSADAVVLACGARESNPAERGWIAGSRPGGVFFSKNLMGLMDRIDGFTVCQPVILGSDVIAYATAARLRSAGLPEATLQDTRPTPRCSAYERWYFRRWTKPRFIGTEQPPTLTGERSASGVTLSGGRCLPCDVVALCGALVPNSELALMADLAVDVQSRKPSVGPDRQLSSPGWFGAGNMLGGLHGADWCYWNGRCIARSVAKYLRRRSQS